MDQNTCKQIDCLNATGKWKVPLEKHKIVGPLSLVSSKDQMNNILQSLLRKAKDVADPRAFIIEQCQLDAKATAELERKRKRGKDPADGRKRASVAHNDADRVQE